MPIRATKRGPQRTRLARDCDVLVCGASFAGLAVARELAGTGAELVRAGWLGALALMGSFRQSFDELVVHTPWHTGHWRLPWSFATFDYRELCALLWEQADSPTHELAAARVTRPHPH